MIKARTQNVDFHWKNFQSSAWAVPLTVGNKYKIGYRKVSSGTNSHTVETQKKSSRIFFIHNLIIFCSICRQTRQDKQSVKLIPQTGCKVSKVLSIKSKVFVKLRKRFFFLRKKNLWILLYIAGSGRSLCEHFFFFFFLYSATCVVR